ncbi:hypothetical protein Zmor_023484 [Zophobas morio]|uniref:Reverse transcriptase n=1 Tax=Zophobas morio TaxID=2755281 RepID=A0AA38M750_9CUCU|nr:hypothetical protein Zmor_023484 [Zophobas morio]
MASPVNPGFCSKVLYETWQSELLVTQFLRGHGAFRSFMYRIGKTTVDLCGSCQVQNTSEHAMFECRRSDSRRKVAEDTLSIKISTSSCVEIMLRDEESWAVIEELISSRMKMRRRKKEI